MMVRIQVRESSNRVSTKIISQIGVSSSGSVNKDDHKNGVGGTEASGLLEVLHEFIDVEVVLIIECDQIGISYIAHT